MLVSLIIFNQFPKIASVQNVSGKILLGQKRECQVITGKGYKARWRTKAPELCF